MKLLSFIGTGKLQKTRYSFRDRQIETSVVQEAICSFFPITEVVLFTTEKASLINYSEVSEKLPSVRKVIVPDGRTESELWQIFLIVAGEVQQGDKIIFDITHGFRSLPFIATLSAAYLQDVKEADLTALLYGAFDATENGVTPIFDLSGFLEIFSWMAGVRSFLTHVDAGEIHRLVRSITAEMYRDSNLSEKPIHLNNFATRLDAFTSSVRLSRPVESISSAAGIIESLPSAEEEMATFTPALVPLLGKIASVSRFASPDPDITEGITPAYLEKQLEIIRFQVEKGLYQPAVTLAREWMISVLIYAAGDGNRWLNKSTRENAEWTFGGASRKLQNSGFEKTMYSSWFLNLPVWKECTGIWDEISGIRNEIAHCGMNEKKQKTKRLESRVLGMIDSLSRYFKQMTQ
ncbi:TIGR02221 family CRISPR-associated protein [Methanospirillum sp.]|uniref:TIGR02221 family CRISPR-associated protein n=1 Tax=Methanospirillum sp. TaxID=45200 RepID=UPI0035A040FD